MATIPIPRPNPTRGLLTSGQPAGMLGGFNSAVQNNQAMLLGLASGLLGAPTLAEGMSRGFAYAGQGMQDDQRRRMLAQQEEERRKAQADAEAQKAGLQDFLMGHGGYAGKFGGLIETNPELAFDLFQDTRSRKRSRREDQRSRRQDMQDYERKLKLQQQYGGGQSPESFGVTPGFVQTPDGPQAIQYGSRGTIKYHPLPKGYQPYDPYTIASERARGAAAGKMAGEAQADLGGTLTKADQSLDVIDKAINHPGRETATGASGVFDPRNYIPGTDAYNFRVVNKQLAGQAFLEAFESLKGAGQITEVEGQKATEAMARLDLAQSDDEYLAALQELKGIIEAGKQRARQRANGTATPARTSGQTQSGTKWSLEP